MPEPTYEELKARLADLEKQGPKRTGSLEFRVSEKGGVSVYGLGRFPVTLYTAPGCELCTNARAHLNKRGIPFGEKTITTAEDNAAFKAATGASALPVMMLGNGKQVGFDGDIWDAALTAAGYPATSQLPPGYKPALPTAAAPEKPAAADAKAKPDAAASAAAPPPSPAPADPSGERPGWFIGF